MFAYIVPRKMPQLEIACIRNRNSLRVIVDCQATVDISWIVGYLIEQVFIKTENFPLICRGGKKNRLLY